MKSAVVVFSGYNQRAVIAFLRTLKELGVDFGVVASSAEDTIFLTDYGASVLATRQKKELDLDDLLECIGQIKNSMPADNYMIVPSTEALNRYLLANKEAFEKAGCTIPLVGKQLYETISDKRSFGDLCKTYGIKVPPEYDEVRVPCVAKPRQYFTAGGEVQSPVLILDDARKKDFVATHDAKDFYFQEYINGDSLYLLYYFYGSGETVKLSQQNLIQQPDGKSIIAATTSDLHQTTVSDKYEELFRSLGFKGLVMIELRKQGGEHYMIEANPRFWGPSQLFMDAGINLFHDFLYDSGLLKEKPDHPEPGEAKYFWGGGLEESDGNEAYHGYSPERLKKDLSAWQAADIYNREDTKRLYEREISAKYER